MALRVREVTWVLRETLEVRDPSALQVPLGAMAVKEILVPGVRRETLDPVVDPDLPVARDRQVPREAREARGGPDPAAPLVPPVARDRQVQRVKREKEVFKEYQGA